MATIEELRNASKSLHEKLLAMQAQSKGILRMAHVENDVDAICPQAAALRFGLADFSRNSTAGAAAPSSQSARPRAANAAARSSGSSQALLPPPPPPPQREPISPRRYLTYDAELYLHCRLCDKVADENHLQSAGHRRRVENICHYMHYVLPKDDENLQ